MTETITTFDIADYLDNDEQIAEYLNQVLDDGDTDELLRALGHIAKAKGMSSLAIETGLGRESLYKALKPGSRPRFDTVYKVIKALGVHLQATPVQPSNIQSGA